MALAELREKIHQLVDEADEQLLEGIYDLLNRQDDGLTEEQRKDLEKRIARHKRGESKSYTWDEVKAKLKR